MTDYSSDSSSASNESIASYAEDALAECEADNYLRELEESLDVVMKHHDGTLRYPFNRLKDPFVAIDKGMSGQATNDDVCRRLSTREQKVWTSLWSHDHCNMESDTADAFDALIEVGFRAAGGTRGDVGVMYSVVCALLDARENKSVRAPRII